MSGSAATLSWLPHLLEELINAIDTATVFGAFGVVFGAVGVVYGIAGHKVARRADSRAERAEERERAAHERAERAETRERERDDRDEHRLERDRRDDRIAQLDRIRMLIRELEAATADAFKGEASSIGTINAGKAALAEALVGAVYLPACWYIAENGAAGGTAAAQAEIEARIVLELAGVPEFRPFRD